MDLDAPIDHLDPLAPADGTYAISRHANGQPASEGMQVNGVQQGRWQFWDEGGRLRRDVTFANGILHGAYATWHANGAPASTGRFDSGRQQGVWREWHANGRQRLAARYHDGRPYGVWQRWDELGRETGRVDYAKR